jgi:hypothetical protein
MAETSPGLNVTSDAATLSFSISILTVGSPFAGVCAFGAAALSCANATPEPASAANAKATANLETICKYLFMMPPNTLAKWLNECTPVGNFLPWGARGAIGQNVGCA